MPVLVRSCLFLSFLFLLHSSVSAQTSLTARVADSSSRQALPLVTISLLSANDSSLVKRQVTDTAGIFILGEIPVGKYLLLLSASGYRPFYQKIEIDQHTSKALDLGSILLMADPKLLNEVVVTGERAVMQRQGEKLVVTVSGNRFFRTAANALDILKKIPGLEVNGDGTLLLSGRVAPSVFIDGKPMPMSAEELQNYLTSLSPEMIASVEVISNPSARYDGEHKGIIDIKLKRDLTLGWKGTLTSTIQRNAYTLSDQNLLLTYKSKKIAYTTRLGYTVGTSIYRYQALQHLSNKNILATRTMVPNSNNNLNYQFGADYAINNNHRVELLLRAYKVDRDTRSFNTLNTMDSSDKNQVSHSNTRNSFEPQQKNYAANLSYSGQFKKMQVQFLGNLVKISNRQSEDIITRNTLTGDLLTHWITRLKNDILIRAAQADLSREAFKGKISFGTKFAFTTTRNDLQYDTLNTGNVFVPDSGRTNNFQYDEYITAGYFSYERRVKKLNYSIGLRAEHTHSLANAITDKQLTKRDYLTWLPAVSVTYVDDNRQYHFSYTRRMTRPNFSQLNPFRFYTSPLNYNVGNPLLLPAKQDVINISYSYKSFNASLTGGKETDVLSRYPEYNDTTHVLQYLGRNLPYNHFLGLETSYSFSLTKWWRLTHTLSINYKKELTPYHDVTYSIGITQYTINGNQAFSLPKGFSLDLYYRYLSSGGNGLYFSRPYLTVDLGLQKAWLKGKLNTRLNYYDIFDEYEIHYIFREKQIINNELKHWFGSNRVALTVSYSFGKSTHKLRQGSKNEEEGRGGF
jgi:hypothetical protein